MLSLLATSLSARRAWIEMGKRKISNHPGRVALRKESVDRNKALGLPGWLRVLSLSARRAWIEIATALLVYLALIRSLSARRAWIEIYNSGNSCTQAESLSARRAWIEILLMSILYMLAWSLSARRAWIEMCRP